MRKSLVMSMVLSVGLLAAAWIAATGDTISDLVSPLRPKGSSITIEFTSFAMGVAVGVGGVWLSRIPWADIPRALLAMILGWRRNVVLASFAIACTGVLLFY